MSDSLDKVDLPESLPPIEEETSISVRPDYVSTIVALTRNALEEAQYDADVPPTAILVLSTKAFFDQLKVVSVTDFYNVVFTYALAAHMEKSQLDDIQQDRPPQTRDALQSQALLDIASLYQYDPESMAYRRLFSRAALAVHTAVCEMLSHYTDVPMSLAMSALGELALVVQTLNVYIKKSRRQDNKPYTDWVLTILKEWLHNPRDTILTFSESSKGIIAQIQTEKRIIKL